MSQWGIVEADTSTGLELRGISSLEFDKQAGTLPGPCCPDPFYSVSPENRPRVWRCGLVPTFSLLRHVSCGTQGELFVATSGNRVHLFNAEDEFISAYSGRARTRPSCRGDRACPLPATVCSTFADPLTSARCAAQARRQRCSPSTRASSSAACTGTTSKWTLCVSHGVERR